MRFPNEKTVERIRREYPAGTLVELVKMDDVHAPPVGTIGKVIHVDDCATIHIAWRNGSTLGAVFGEDVVRKVADSYAQ